MKIVDGNKACSKIAYLFSEVCAIYPITPSSPMAENIDYLSHTELNNIYNSKPEVVEMESEMGAAGALHGALMSGSLASTFTASQGLLLMIPNMYKIAGEMWPGVIHVAARSLATHALSIFGDHQDIYAVRQTGFCMLSSTSVEDAQNLAAVAHLSAIKGSLPFVHFFDGFRTSHELNTIDELDEAKIISLLDKEGLNNFKKRALNVGCNKEFGTSQTEDVYFQCTEARNLKYMKMPDIVNEYMIRINEITGKDYKPFNYYGDDCATNVIVAMGSVCDTIKAVIDKENQSGRKIGLIEVHLYRPFSVKYLLDVLPKTVQRMAVLDRTKEAGSVGEPLYLDIVGALKETNIEIVGGRYGLSSKNTTPDQILAVYNMLDSKLQNSFTIGINDDVTHLSLPVQKYEVDLSCQEFKIWGFGSDGMVSASKDILTIANASLGKYVQGYFEYDSKKSGGVTISHLRVGDKAINVPYYVINPSIVVITKDEYFKKFDMLSEARNGAYVLVNTIKNQDEFNAFLPSDVKKIIRDKNLKINIINAEKIAYANNIRGKINKIMEVNILKLLGISNAVELVVESIKKAFATKGQDIVVNNVNAVNESLNSIVEINVTLSDEPEKQIKEKDIFEIMECRLGNTLSVGDVLPIAGGEFPGNLSRREKRNVANLTPKWDKDKCIQCGMCSFVCPHSVIRNFVTEDKTLGKPLIGKDQYNFFVGISNYDCTSCGLCVNICPTHALTMEENVEPTNELFDSYENPQVFNKYTIKGSQLAKPRFEFSGACAGCGETPYVKLLTQLLGDKLVIANATGCSSIYGASAPCMPYSIPWANSLFEDNAEFAYGIHISYKQKRKRIRQIMEASIGAVDLETKELFNRYLGNENDERITSEVANLLQNKNIPKELVDLKEYMPARTVWALGGDGWAYDIGYNGLDHILHSNENIKVLVLDTEVYSNTGGQASKSTKKGAVAEFADFGKKTTKKDLFRIASSIENCYVASISLGANMMQTIKAFKEAEEHNGPAIIIAYCPCVEHGIKNGMGNSIREEKLGVECGYTLLMRYFDNKLYLDSPEPDFEKYREFLDNEVRFKALKIKNAEYAEEILEQQKANAIKRYNYYKNLENKN
ncbi:MAG: pyruvate:ferredoxin (flavodoxin) oxidoreductase [Firmicutes bacterium]|nr:pyruvate:ferredoxin (flavodoxin) oxidoreductase [Bacillota bacterium]